jgi:hypothetical protein
LKDASSSEELEVKVDLDLPEDRVFAEEVNLVIRHLGELVRIALQESYEE